jgi:glutathione S-transferase
MKLHWSPRSPFVRKVMIVAHERGVADRLNCVRTVAEMTTPRAELMKDNPLSKIPTLVLDDGLVLYDSPVICEYLDALDGDPRLFPQHGRARIVALRRQALGDGFLDLLVLARNERMRPQPSQAHLASAATRTRDARSFGGRRGGARGESVQYRSYRDWLRALLSRFSLCRAGLASRPSTPCELACVVRRTPLGAGNLAGR